MQKNRAIQQGNHGIAVLYKMGKPCHLLIFLVPVDKSVELKTQEKLENHSNLRQEVNTI